MIGSESIQNDEKSIKYINAMIQQKAEPDESETFERLYHTFGGVGWPVVQSGLSTMIGKNSR
jgi:hypothetical protein